MEMVSVKLENLKDVVVKQARFDNEYAVGCLKNNEDLYLINKKSMIATRIPEEYQKTEVTMYPPRGGCANGLLMVNRKEADACENTKAFYGSAGKWGWVDMSFKEIIKPEYKYATNFVDGKAVVCKEIILENKYDKSSNDCMEVWGIIDQNGREIISCKYDEINTIIGTSRYFLAHIGGWTSGHFCLVDSSIGKEILNIDFSVSPESIFSDRYMLDDDIVVFVERYEGVDFNYAYSISNSRYLQYGEKVLGEGTDELCKYRFNGSMFGSLIAAS